MLISNQERNVKKVEQAVNAIRDLIKKEEQVTVGELVKRTGLSRSFFYTNETVRSELDKAQKLQGGKSFVAPQKVAIDKALERKCEFLEKKLMERDRTIAELQKEITKLKKNKNIKVLSIIKDL